MGLKQVCACSILVAAGFLWVGCKFGSEKKKPAETAASQDAQLATAQGFFLQDLKTLSGHMVRVVRGGDVFSPSVGQGVLVSDSVALVPGFDCSGTGLSLVFSVQKNEPPDQVANLGGVVRPVDKCETFEQVVENRDRQAEGTGRSDLVAAARSLLASAQGFSLARLQFGGGLPQDKEPKWAPVSVHHGRSSAVAENFAAWSQLVGKYVFWAGFTRDLASSQGPAALRVWFPFRVANPATDDPTQLIALESAFTDGERSPLSSAESWAQGPDRHLLPGFVFAGVSRYPNIRAFTEIESSAPELLCFVTNWHENVDAPIGVRYSPYCLDAALFVSIMR